MSKKKVDKKNEELKELEDMLEEETKNKDCEEKVNNLQSENSKLKKELKEKEEMLKNTQLQYISLKNDFDLFVRRNKENEEKIKNEIFEKVILKVLPIIEDFTKSYEHLPKEFKDHKWTEGLNLINKKLENFLNEHNIEIIETIGKDIDELKHEAIGFEAVEDENKKGKIVKEVTKGYVIDNKVLKPAKVIIGQ